MATETSPEAPGATVTVRGVATPPIPLPETKLTLYAVVHGQEPVLESFQVLVKVCPAVIAVSSGMVTSETNAELLHPTAVEPPPPPAVSVFVGPSGRARNVGVIVGVKDGVAVENKVGVAVAGPSVSC